MVQHYGCGLNVPSRLKGIETLILALVLLGFLCLNVPSRLKGIETNITFFWGIAWTAV